MKIIGLVFILLMVARGAAASQQQYMSAIGSSAKGQIIALEEYGYRPDDHIYYVSIRLINVWTSEDVGSVVQVETPAVHTDSLMKARSQAKNLSRAQFEKFKIISH